LNDLGFWVRKCGIDWIDPRKFLLKHDECDSFLTIVANKLHCAMPTIIKSDAFAEWIDNLRDRAGAAQVLRRLARLERGNPGDVAPVGEGVSELKIHFGPGYRVYFAQRGEELVIILGGGDKASQARDIKAAKTLWEEWKEQNR